MPQRNPKNGIYKLKRVPEVSKDKGLGHSKIREACPISRCFSGSGASPTLNKCKSNLIATTTLVLSFLGTGSLLFSPL